MPEGIQAAGALGPDMLTDEQRMIRDAARDFAAGRVTPDAAEWDRTKVFPVDVAREMAALGLHGIQVPEAYGGAGADHVAYALAMEEIAYGDGGLSTFMTIQNSVFTAPVMKFGTEAQKEDWVRPVAEGRLFACFCLTEPGAGSDVAAIRTRARRDGDAYVIDGHKQFITGARHADLALIFAVTDPEAGKKGLSAFLTRTDADGFTILRDEDKMGQRAGESCQLAFDGLRVPADRMLGAPGEGLKIALSNLEGGRIGIAAQAIGMARAALDHAVAYARERTSMGKVIAEHQAVAFRLAEMATKVETARQMVLHAARLRDAGRPCLKEVAIAKLHATEMAEEVVSDALQTLGGYGYVNDYPIEKIYRDVRVCKIYEGTSDIQKMLIARELLRD